MATSNRKKDYHRSAIDAFKGPARQNAVGSLLIQGSQRLSRFVVIIAAAALLTPAAFATAALALALTDLIRGGLLAFDVDAVRQLSRGDNAPNVVQTSLDAKGLAGVAGLLLVAAVAALAYNPSTAWLVLVSGIGVLAASFAASFLVQQQAALALRSVSSRVATASAAGAVVGVLMTWLTRGAGGVVVGTAIGDGLLLAFVCGRHRWRRPDWRMAVALVRANRRLLFMQLAYIGQFRVGTIVLAAMGSAVAVGEYAIASRVAESLIIVAAALTASSLPMIGAAHARNEHVGLTSIFERSYSVGVRIIAPSVALLVLAAPIWIGLVFPRYPDVGTATGIVGLAVIVFFASSQTTALLNATRHDNAASWSALAGLGASALGSIALFPFGAIGVAYARFAGDFVRLAVEAAAAIRDLGVRPAQLIRPWLSVSPILVGLGIAIVGNWQSPYIWVAVLIVSAGAGWLLTALRDTAPAVDMTRERQ